MKIIKKWMTMVLTLVLTVCTASSAFASGLPFEDVPSDSWFYDGVSYVYENGIMNGVSSGEFQPDSQATRAMVVSILWRIDGSMDTGNEFFYQDKEENSWYAEAIDWSSANGIMNGYSTEIFGVQDPITREQLATVLYRYAAAIGCDVSEGQDLSGYTDQSSISSYAKEALSWANKAGLIKGISSTTLAPRNTATRAQIATIIERFEKIRNGVTLSSGGKTSEEILQAVALYAESVMKKDASVFYDVSNAYIYAQNCSAAIVFMGVQKEDEESIEAIWVSKDTGETRSCGYFQDYWPSMFNVFTGEVNETDSQEEGQSVNESEALRLAIACSRNLSEDEITKVNENDVWVYDQNEDAFLIYVGVRDGYGSGWYDVIRVDRASGEVMYVAKTQDTSPGLYDVSSGTRIG